MAGARRLLPHFAGFEHWARQRETADTMVSVSATRLLPQLHRLQLRPRVIIATTSTAILYCELFSISKRAASRSKLMYMMYTLAMKYLETSSHSFSVVWALELQNSSLCCHSPACFRHTSEVSSGVLSGLSIFASPSSSNCSYTDSSRIQPFLLGPLVFSLMFSNVFLSVAQQLLSSRPHICIACSSSYSTLFHCSLFPGLSLLDNGRHAPRVAACNVTGCPWYRWLCWSHVCQAPSC